MTDERRVRVRGGRVADAAQAGLQALGRGPVEPDADDLPAKKAPPKPKGKAKHKKGGKR